MVQKTRSIIKDDYFYFTEFLDMISHFTLADICNYNIENSEYLINRGDTVIYMNC